MEIFATFDFTHLQTEAAWVVIIYIAVLTAMILDFITGVRKASLRGEATTSRGFRRTAEKASQYFLPMMCLTAIDVIASIYLDYPYLTATMGAFNIYIEVCPDNCSEWDADEDGAYLSEDLIIENGEWMF